LLNQILQIYILKNYYRQSQNVIYIFKQVFQNTWTKKYWYDYCSIFCLWYGLTLDSIAYYNGFI